MARGLGLALQRVGEQGRRDGSGIHRLGEVPARRRPGWIEQAGRSRQGHAEEAPGGVLPSGGECGGDDARARSGRIETAADDRGLRVRDRQFAAAPRRAAPRGGLCRIGSQPPVDRSAVGEGEGRGPRERRREGGSHRGVRGPMRSGPGAARVRQRNGRGAAAGAGEGRGVCGGSVLHREAARRRAQVGGWDEKRDFNRRRGRGRGRGLERRRRWWSGPGAGCRL